MVVYQTVSNFGQTARPGLGALLQTLQRENLVDELVLYEPRARFEPDEAQRLVHRVALDHGELAESGGATSVAPQFFNEVRKREIGRQRCAAAGCSHFLLMDTDEFYLGHQLDDAIARILANDYDATMCYMRVQFRTPEYEYFPYDDVNAVPFIHRITEAPLQIASPYPVIVDPTRRVSAYARPHIFHRDDLVMFHMSLVRADIELKLSNVSNRGNLTLSREFVSKFRSWTPGDPPVHPHPLLAGLYKSVRRLPNYFGVDLSKMCRRCLRTHNLSRCSRCLKVFYCSTDCQRADWPGHKPACAQPV